METSSVREMVQRANGSNNNNNNNNKEEEEKKPEYRKNRLSKIHTLLKGVNELRPVLSIFLYRFGQNSAQDISN
jgi:hypothetical protein